MIDRALPGALPGPHPRLDEDLGLIPAHNQQWMLEPSTVEAFSLPKEVIKGDSQKADNAAVPDHLWQWAFVQGYGDPRIAEQHLTAL